MSPEEHLANCYRRVVSAGCLTLYVWGSTIYRICLETAVWWRFR